MLHRLFGFDGGGFRSVAFVCSGSSCRSGAWVCGVADAARDFAVLGFFSGARSFLDVAAVAKLSGFLPGRHRCGGGAGAVVLCRRPLGSRRGPGGFWCSGLSVEPSFPQLFLSLARLRLHGVPASLESSGAVCWRSWSEVLLSDGDAGEIWTALARLLGCGGRCGGFAVCSSSASTSGGDAELGKVVGFVPTGDPYRRCARPFAAGLR